MGGRHGARPTRILPSFLFDNRQPRWRYVLLAWPVSLLPAMALGFTLEAMVPHPPAVVLVGGWLETSKIVFFAPLFESAIMAALLGVFLRFLPSTGAVALSALFWGLVHAVTAPFQGLVVWWPFLIFSIAYVTWRAHEEAGSAVLLVGCVHALYNGSLLLADRFAG